MPSVSVRKLYQDNQQKLNLTWVAGRSGSDNLIGNDDQRPTLSLVGHLNFIHPNRVQVLGLAEVDYLSRLEKSAAKTALDQLFYKSMSVVIVANAQVVPALLRDYCHTHNVPLMTTTLESPYLMDVLRIYLARALAVSTVLHGVFLDVLEIGVLIMGDSAMGKSELALELISRGHGLVADDAVEYYRIGPDTLEGRCPALLRDFLEVRGLGILNIRTVFGETAVRPKKVLKLIIHLIKANDQAMQALDRLNIQSETQDILGVTVRKVILPVAAGRNLAVLVEAAVRNYILQLRGIDSTREFVERHTNFLRDQEHAADSD
ncbi:HPr kinase/phosphorylase [Aquitalea sp. S1-19]|uniref:HPr kinase/phosphorylase n=1 Tax=Craterilacuibacter sinensis TaxID=2686017 RepID=A0A845BQ97_9NEIS|nr:HPr(Ser) kinase/phosphatase [Craterilacuibacter sinensis]MCP9759438.1 HPr kinase/phosphorylase [Aquitalea sp. S1-19]MXR37338.1 HPr kinase/phosphorylase [Craterilacuibacter sinensis]RQW24593.1 HPr kinase/phosphorylase [Rhodobacteraceae bacterium CH30]